ncbi:phospholipase ABHD3-like [Rhopilema esculentum]|uniref:phospholipase ABHD3-like n=1 Tax=Rhopilema esculentum TaxID=499914 RepID=UPI0031CDEDE7
MIDYLVGCMLAYFVILSHPAYTMDEAQHFFATSAILSFDWQIFCLGLSFVYMFYYLLFVVRRPRLICRDGKFRRKLKQHMLIMNEYYWPTFWCFSSHMMTVCCAVFRAKLPVPYRREYIETPDGEKLCLDWVDNDDSNSIHPDITTRPTLVIVPGMTGCSDESYCRNLVLAAKEMGMRSLVMTNRGSGKNWTLKTPRMFSGNNTDDLRLVMKYLESMFPKSPVIGMGISFGGCIMTHYVSELNKNQKQMIGAFLISVQWNCYKSLDSLEKPFNWLLYNRYLTKHLKAIIQRNLHVYEQHMNDLPFSLDHVFKSKTIREFDDRLTSKMFGYENHKEYYDEATLDSEHLLAKIRIPTMFLNSADDPFAPEETIPKELICKNPSISLLLTEYGGHIGFMDSSLITSKSLMEKTFQQFAHVILKKGSIS